MTPTKINQKHRSPAKSKLPPPAGQIKIAESLRELLEKKNFNAITTAEIARTAGVTEALIYKYYRDKRDLLHQILVIYNEQFFAQLVIDLKGIKGALNKLRKLIWSSIHCYSSNRIYAKILLLEVRNSPHYYKSKAYEGIKKYGNIIMEIIQEGIDHGEIRQDLPPHFIRQVIIGGIEHVCLPGIIFNREIMSDILTEHLCTLLLEGMVRPESSRST
jgi:AcrR family transcriptional regulator